jgi:hypothetical protein
MPKSCRRRVIMVLSEALLQSYLAKALLKKVDLAEAMLV